MKSMDAHSTLNRPTVDVQAEAINQPIAPKAERIAVTTDSLHLAAPKFSLWEAWQEVSARHLLQNYVASMVTAVVALTAYAQDISFIPAALASITFFIYRWYSSGANGSTVAKYRRRARIAIYMFYTSITFVVLALVFYFFRGSF